MKAQFSILALSIMSTSALAQLSDEAGISGEVSLNAGFSSSSSSFDTDGDKTITDNQKSASSESGFIALPLGSLAYTFGDNLDKQVYLGTAREDIAVGNLALEIGYKQQLANETVVDLAILPTLMSGETWADPFKVGSERQTTDETGIAYRLQLKKIAGTNFSLDTAYATKDIKDEKSGISDTNIPDAERKSLQRDSTTIFVKGDYQYMLNKTSFIQPSLSYTKIDADGDANSSTAFGGELSYFKLMNKHQFALTAGYTSRSFDAINPIYGKKHDESELSLFAAYEYQEFMGWEDWSLISFVGYGQTDSDIDFYDEDQTFMSVGMNYQF